MAGTRLSAAILLLFCCLPATGEDLKGSPTTIQVTVVARESGAPLPGVAVEMDLGKHEETRETDGDGVVVFPVVLEEYRVLHLTVEDAPGRAAYRYTWRPEIDTAPVPESVRMALPKAETIGGTVVDEAGLPVAGAKVYLISDAEREGDWRHGPAIDDNLVGTTDGDGRWRYTSAPPELLDFWLRVNHDDYLSSDVYNRRASLEDLHAESVQFELKKGATLSGRVVDEKGEPVSHAKVTAGRQRYDREETQSDDDGKFSFTAVEDTDQLLVVQHPKFAPQYRTVARADLGVAQEFALDRGKRITLRVLDPDGEPLEGARVSLSGWGGGEDLLDGIGANGRTNRRGEWKWRAAPEEPVTYEVRAKGWVHAAPEVLEADGETYDITLKKPFQISGRVTDKATGEPISSGRAMKVCVWDSGGLHTSRDHATDLEGGAFEIAFERNDCGHMVLVEALGYRPHFTEAYRQEDDSVVLDIALEPAENVTGMVTNIDGKPVEDVRVVMCTPTMQVNIGSNGIDDVWRYLEDTTDGKGRFTLPPQGDDFVLLATDDRGYGELTRAQWEAEPVMRLREWASVSGTFAWDGEPVAGMTMSLSPLRARTWGLPIVAEYQSTETNADGRFTFDRVAPRPYGVGGRIGPWIDAVVPSAAWKALDIQPGEHYDLDFSKGRSVVGRLALPAEDDRDFAFNWSINYLVKKAPGIPVDVPGVERFDVMKGWNEAWLASTEGGVYFGSLDKHAFKIQPDGQFEISGVTPGEFMLACRLFAPPEGSCLTEPLVTVTHDVTVESTGEGNIDVGTIVARLRPPLKVGEAVPDFDGTLVDGTPFRLSDLKGQYVLLDFWATWCAPCRAELPNLKRAWERYGNRVAFVGLSLDAELAPVKRYIEQEGLSWTQIHLGDWSQSDVPGRYNVSGIPQVILIDPEGNLVHTFLRGPALHKALEEAIGE